VQKAHETKETQSPSVPAQEAPKQPIAQSQVPESDQQNRVVQPIPIIQEPPKQPVAQTQVPESDQQNRMVQPIPIIEEPPKQEIPEPKVAEIVQAPIQPPKVDSVVKAQPEVQATREETKPLETTVPEAQNIVPEQTSVPVVGTVPDAKPRTPIPNPPDDVEIPPLPQEQIPIHQPRPQHPPGSRLRYNPPPINTSIGKVKSAKSAPPTRQPASAPPQTQPVPDRRASEVQRTSYQATQAQPTIPEESTENGAQPHTPSYHPPPLLPRPATSHEQPLHSRPQVQRKVSAPVASRNPNMYPISETNVPSTHGAPPQPEMPPPPPPKIPLPGLVTSNLPGQAKSGVFSPSQVPLPDSAMPSSPTPSQIPLPESAIGTNVATRAESLLRRAMMEQQHRQAGYGGKENRPPSVGSPGTHKTSGSVRSIDRRSIQQEPIELPAGGEDDDEPVMKAVSYPGDEWVPRWDGD
jgi:hypothetical protein